MDKSNGSPVGSVMVVGGGAAGIQAALDLADSGFFVYLVEKTSAIGGTMSQLDKVFPTNDCSMCIISPKLVECGSHPNIELLTLSELTGLEGEAGHFRATVLRHPRFIDLSKCTGCGECATVCPVHRKNEFDGGLSTRKAVYKRYPQAVPSGFAVEKKGISPCKASCPANVSVQGYIALAAEGRFREALALIKRANPLPAVCGRVCDHPCETACSRNEIDQPVAIDSIKRFIADLDLNSGTRYVPEIKHSRTEKVAVIGSGPAGLTCAYYLAVEGYRVTVFEKLPVPGGMLAVGIPAYRLPRDILNAEIQVIRDLGVEFRTGVRIGTDVTIAELRDLGYRAFFIAVGAHECRGLGIDGENLEGVYAGLDYLREVNLGRDVPLGNRVAVIGGGNVALDAARTARRCGSAHPVVIYRRGPEEMPASAEELEECREEGIEIVTLAAPTRILGDPGRVKAVECVRMTLGEPDSSGRRRPEPVPGSEFIMEVDAVIPAIGQESDWACLTPDCACTLTDWKTMRVDPVTLQSDDPDIFAGGDAVAGPGMVVEAIAAGKRAAVSIDRAIRGIDLREGREEERTPVGDVDVAGRDRIPREPMPKLPPPLRTAGFDEVRLGFSEEQVRKEAARCLQCGVCSECLQCVSACTAGAVCHDQKPFDRTIEVGSVILAPGARTFDPSRLDVYLYGKHPNVVTSLDFERILSASGPFLGHLVRPSDGKVPRGIAWLQCVGSRNLNECGNGYCSSICCMAAIKEAMVAKEHSPAPLDAAVFFSDMRTCGKDFDTYYDRSRNEYGLRFVRSCVNGIRAAPGDRLVIDYTSEEGEPGTEEFDMVVLSVGLEIPPDVTDLARKIGVRTNRHGFALTEGFTPASTSRPGVYVCGLFQGPKEIPFAVADAGAAVCAASCDLAEARGSMVKAKELPPEIDQADTPPRIGVFVCNCGINIGSVVHVEEVADYASRLPNVVRTEQFLFTCSEDSREKIRKAIVDDRLNRVVVAACSPQTHEPFFQETLRSCGINRYLFEMANIRNQDSWVHQDDPERATAKAKDLVRMAVARVSLLKPLVEKPLSIRRKALVIGGGVAGLNASLGIARQGLDVVLVEKDTELGGMARHIGHTIEGLDVRAYLDGLVKEVREHPKIEVLTDAALLDFKGYKGNFTTEVRVGAENGTRRIEHGAVIVASGAREYRPAEFLYGRDDRVMTQVELGRLLTGNEHETHGWSRVVMIQCVGSRSAENPNCSRTCCETAVRHALTLKDADPAMDVVILYRDVRMYGTLEEYYVEARNRGIRFVRYEAEHPPDVAIDNGSLSATYRDIPLRRQVRVDADAVVLSTATVAEGNERLATLLKLSRDPQGFFIEAHTVLRPVDFSSEGMYLCGMAQGPKLIGESVTQAMAAASRAASFLSSTDRTVGGMVATVDESRCVACLSCVRNCPYGVPRINDRGVSEINEAICQGCGICASECPAKAIRLANYGDDQVMIKVDALLEGIV